MARQKKKQAMRRTALAATAALLVLQFHARAQSPPDPHPLENWMGDMRAQLARLQVNNVAIPGTHDSGTYALSANSRFATDDLAHTVAGALNGAISWLNTRLPDDLDELSPSQAALALDATAPAELKSFVAGWGRAQDRTITEQLQDGIRFLDLRVAGNVSDHGNAWVAHGMFSVPMTSVVDQIEAFMQTHPYEVLIVEMGHHNSMSVAAHNRLILYMGNHLARWAVVPSTIAELSEGRQRAFTSFTPPSSPEPLPTVTFETLWNLDKRLFLIYADDSSAYNFDSPALDPNGLAAAQRANGTRRFSGSETWAFLWHDSSAIETDWPQATEADEMVSSLVQTRIRRENYLDIDPFLHGFGNGCFDCPFELDSVIITPTTEVFAKSLLDHSILKAVNPVYQGVLTAIETLKSCHVNDDFPFIHCTVTTVPPIIPPQPGTLFEWNGPGSRGQNVGPTWLQYLDVAWQRHNSLDGAIGSLNLVMIDHYESVRDEALGSSYVEAIVNFNRQLGTPTVSDPNFVGRPVVFHLPLAPMTAVALANRDDIISRFQTASYPFIFWDFGDGTTSCLPTDPRDKSQCRQPPDVASHVYAETGCYVVRAFLMAFNGPRNESHTFFCVAPNLPPTIRPTVTGTLGDNGWYRSDVGISWDISTAAGLAGSQGCDPTTVTADVDTTFTCSATASQGLSATASVEIRRDTTPPAGSWIASPATPNGASGFYVSDLSLQLVCSDALSGVNACGSGAPVALTQDGLNQRSPDATVSDRAGNVASVAPLTGINIDRTPPAIVASRTAANAAGWNNSSVTVSFQCSDAVAGLAAGSPPAPTVVSVSGAGQNVRGTCTDRAGNSASAVVENVDIDAIRPVVTIAARKTVLWPPNGHLAPDVISGRISDALSGIDPATARFHVRDEYGRIEHAGSIQIGPDGSYSFSVLLKASRSGRDRDGRRYWITVRARDTAGNLGSATTSVIVPHDRRK